MKTTPSHLKAILLLVSSVLLAPVSRGEVSQSSTASTAAIAIDRTQYFNQLSSSAPVAQSLPFSLNFNIRGTSQDTSAWGPAFYKPGSGGTPASGSSSATNTGTLNFSTAPNNGPHGYAFTHDFATNADLVATYPLGAYGVKFLGAGKPTTPRSDNPFVAGLEFATSGATYPSVTPRIASVNNGATWSAGNLQLSSTGVTTLTLNAFPEYSSSTYGSVITAGIYDASNGNVVASASVEAYYLPTLGVNQPAITQLTIDGSWLTPGIHYTLEVQYVIIASAPVEGYLNNENFQGVASYVKNTSINVTVGPGAPPPPVAGKADDFNQDGKADIIFQDPNSGEIKVWFMNGTTILSSGTIAAPAGWKVCGNGDFDGDGKTDIIAQNTSTGQVDVWLMNGTTIVSSVNITTQPAFRVMGAADFDGDGKTDIIWQNPYDGMVIIWTMNGFVMKDWSIITTQPSFRVTGAGDFDGDGKGDILWQNPADGMVIIWTMNGFAMKNYAIVSTQPCYNAAGVADLNGDGKAELIWQGIYDGMVITWGMNADFSMATWAIVGTDETHAVVNH